MNQPSFTRDQLTRARWGVALIFATNGAAFASLAPRLPEVKADLSLTNSMFGLAVAAFPAGALAAGAFAGVLVRRFGSALVAWAGMVLSMVGILGAASAPSLALFAAAVLIGGCADSVTDVAQNHHALRVQKLLGRSIINSYHAMWSVGALIGGVVGAGAIAVGLDRRVHVGIMCVLILALATWGWRMLLPGREPVEAAEAHAAGAEGAQAWLRHPALVLAALSALALAGAVVEENPGTWATLYMSSELGVTGGLAPAGYVAGLAMHFLGRVVGDGLVNRWGQRGMALFGGLLVMGGMGLAVAWPTALTTVLGYGLAGFGVATVIPSVFEAADALPGLKPGTGVTVTSLVLRLGFLGAPPLVGLIADASAIRWGLLCVVAAGLLVVLLSGALSPRTDPLDTPVVANR